MQAIQQDNIRNSFVIRQLKHINDGKYLVLNLNKEILKIIIINFLLLKYMKVRCYSLIKQALCVVNYVLEIKKPEIMPVI